MANKQSDRSFTSRWGDAFLDDTHFIRLPGWVLHNWRWYVNVGFKTPASSNKDKTEYTLEWSDEAGEIVGLTASERAFITTVMSFRFDSNMSQGAKPSIGLIAHLLGVSDRAVQTTKAKLIEKGALTLEYNYPRRNTDTYVFAEVIRQCRLWQSFWEEVGLPRFTDYKERLKYLETDEGEKNCTLFVGEKIFTLGGEKNCTQRVIMLKRDKPENTFQVFSPLDAADAQDKNLKTPNETQTSQPITHTTQSELVNDAPRLQKKLRGIKPKKAGASTPKGATASSDASVSDKRRAANELTAEWLEALLSAMYGDYVWHGFSTASEIKLTRSTYGHHMKAISVIRAVYDKYVLDNVDDIDVSDITPDMLLSHYIGAGGKTNGWLYKHKFDNDELTIGPNAIKNNFVEYITSKRSIIAQRRAALLRKSSLKSDSEVKSHGMMPADEFAKWAAGYMESIGEDTDDLAENQG